MHSGSDLSFRLPTSSSPCELRVLLAVIWIAIVLVLSVVLPWFNPIFDKLRKTGDVSVMKECAITTSQVNYRFYTFPAGVLTLILMKVESEVLELLGQNKRTARFVGLWFFVCCCILAGVLAVAVSPMFPPVP
jgi:hypothetical protein